MKKFRNDYVCFDLETTGFGKNVEIIEIGAVKVRIRGRKNILTR